MEGTKGVLEMQVKFIYKQESIQCSEVFVFFYYILERRQSLLYELKEHTNDKVYIYLTE